MWPIGPSLNPPPIITRKLTGVTLTRAMENDTKTAHSVNHSRECLPPLKQVWNSSISPVITHSKPPIFRKFLMNNLEGIFIYRAIEPQHNQHEEKQHCWNVRSRQRCNSFWIDLKNETGSLIRDRTYGNVEFVGHKAQVRKDDESRKETGEAVDGCRDQTVPQAVIVEFVVTGVGQMHAETSANRVKNLDGCIDPYLFKEKTSQSSGKFDK